MKDFGKKIRVVSIMFILYYIYMNCVKKVMIPFDSLVIPGILLLAILIYFFSSKGVIVYRNKLDKYLCISWIFVGVYVLVNNENLISTIVGGGIIQLYTMITIMCFVRKDDKWREKWIKISIVFVLVHAIATIIFFYNGSLYHKYASFIFSGDTLRTSIKNYNKGYMAGLSSHFSTNGMILGIGIIFIVEKFLDKKRAEKAFKYKLLYGTLACIVMYALILSSKRSPLIAAILAIVIVYILFNQKNIFKNLCILMISCTLIFGAYKFLLPKIPGLSTIATKFETLEDSDAGVLNGRQQLWDIAINMIKKHPVIGNGYGSYEKVAEQEDAITTSAHNYYLHVFAELGIIGVILYLNCFILGLILGVKALNRIVKRKRYKDYIFAKISLEIQIFVLIYAFTSSAFIYYVIVVPYFLALATTRQIWNDSE